MALIVCPECGKEFSDMAAACPNCGCRIADVRKAIAEKELRERTKDIDYEVDGDTTYCKACLNCGTIYWNTNTDGYKGGYCIECRGAKLYDKLIRIEYPTSEFVHKVGSQPDASITKHSKYFQLCKEWRERIYNLERKLFEQYISGWESLDKNCRPYKLNMENLYGNSRGEVHTQIQREAEERAAQQPKPIYFPKCPNCGSPAVQKISDASKGVSFALFGVFSSKFGKQYECKNCGYKW
ncbi:MAG: hypothetical protein ACI3VA_05830 [Candidatus Limivicinus sp.]